MKAGALRANGAAGALDRRCVVLEPISTQDFAGGEAIEWREVAEVWANVSYPSTGSGEAYAVGQQVATRSVLFTLRYRGDVTEKMRVRYEGCEYDIERIEEVGRRGYTRLTTKKRD